ncbi:hypothetical protein CIPAW_10G017600 [Carya illinoinensis]|uniref:Uncharacterized protein n=1 Tax=Carya illinoinensis TaxID=32201 RepID=A0A8T1P8U7_CARIL|nr:hypothetical protein CIPAW_10G017600 [Carya illinoinensis]
MGLGDLWSSTENNGAEGGSEGRSFTHRSGAFLMEGDRLADSVATKNSNALWWSTSVLEEGELTVGIFSGECDICRPN